MDTYSRYALVKPHQDDLRREADLRRLARDARPAGRTGTTRHLAQRLHGRLASLATVVADHARRVPASTRQAATPEPTGRVHSHS